MTYGGSLMKVLGGCGKFDSFVYGVEHQGGGSIDIEYQATWAGSS